MVTVAPILVHDLPVLVVDDNATNRLILEEILSKWHMKPKAVADGQAALVEMKRAAASGTPYALVLSDALMPGMDGFALIEQIKQNPELARSSLLMLSSADHPGDIARCRAGSEPLPDETRQAIGIIGCHHDHAGRVATYR